MNTKSTRVLSALVCLCVIISVAFIPTTKAQSSDSQEFISCVADFAKIVANPGGNFALTADIVFNNDFEPIAAFSGTLDGQGHTISNLSITASTTAPTVAFIIWNSGTIKNIGFLDAEVTGTNSSKNNWAAVIAAKNTGVIETCFVTGTISGGYRSAGICTHNYGTIANCYATANIEAKVECAEITAVSEAGSLIDSCYAVPQVHSQVNNTGGIAAYAYTGATIRNCALFSGSVSNSKAENIGRITGRLKDAPVFSGNIASENVLINNTPVDTGTQSDKNGLTVAESKLLLQSTFEITLGWDFSSTWMMDTALGRPVLRAARERACESVYTISTASDLELIRTYGQNANNRFVFLNDIRLTDTFTPIDSFRGTLDGNGHSIIGLTLQSTGDFPTVAFILNNYGVIENIGFSEAVILGTSNAQTNWASVVVATNNGVVRRVYVSGNISGGHRSSAVVSWNNNVVEDSYCVATVSGKVESGGIAAVAEADSMIRNCYAVPVVFSKNNNTGGICAYAYEKAIIKNCAVLGGLIENGGTNNIARIVGRTNGNPILLNNIASENALVQDARVSSTNAESKQGCTVDRTELESPAIYINILQWDFADCWEMDNALRRPILSGLPEFANDRFVYSTVSDATSTISQGVTRRELVITDVNGNRQVINVLEADLSVAGNSVIVGTNYNAQPPIDSEGNYIRNADAEDHDTFKGTLAEQITTSRTVGVNAVAGVNGEFYTREGPEGYMIKDGGNVVNGTRISTEDGAQYPFHGFFGILDNGTPIIGNYDEDWDQYKSALYQATGGQYQVVANGTVSDFSNAIECDTTDIDYDQETFYRYVSRHPRTAAGIKDGNKILLVTVDGRGYNGSVGVYIEELGRIMKFLGAADAINMDGGGSTTAAYYNDVTSTVDILNTPSNTSGTPYQGKVLRTIFSTVLIVVQEE